MFKEKYGPWAVIAGGSDGIGAAFAWELAARGLNLMLIARNAATLDALAAEITTAHPAVSIRTVVQDLAKDDAAAPIAAAAADIEVGCLIYNVGSETTYGHIMSHDWEFVHGRLNRNLVTKMAMTHHFGQKMRSRGRGGIVLMGSIAAYFGNPGYALYAGSKAFTRYLTEGLWYELKQDNVDVLCPIVGPTDTPSMFKAYGRLDNAADPAVVARKALEHLGDGHPIWIAEEMQDMITQISAMTPAVRAETTAQWAIDFSKSGSNPG